MEVVLVVGIAPTEIVTCSNPHSVVRASQHVNPDTFPRRSKGDVALANFKHRARLYTIRLGAVINRFGLCSCTQYDLPFWDVRLVQSLQQYPTGVLPLL